MYLKTRVDNDIKEFLYIHTDASGKSYVSYYEFLC